jgi:hypothetical protein
MKICKSISYILIILTIFSLSPIYSAELRGPREKSEEIQMEQEDSVIRDNFDINLEIGTQSVWNNSIPIIIHLTTAIDLDRVEIRASTPSAIEFEYLGNQYFPVRAGENYVLTSRVFPNRQGNYTLSINAIAWQYDTNFSSSSTVNLQIDENLQITPQTRQYHINLVLKYILYVILIAGAGIGLFFASKKGYAKLKTWLMPEN